MVFIALYLGSPTTQRSERSLDYHRKRRRSTAASILSALHGCNNSVCTLLISLIEEFQFGVPQEKMQFRDCGGTVY